MGLPASALTGAYRSCPSPDGGSQAASHSPSFHRHVIATGHVATEPGCVPTSLAARWFLLEKWRCVHLAPHLLTRQFLPVGGPGRTAEGAGGAPLAWNQRDCLAFTPPHTVGERLQFCGRWSQCGLGAAASDRREPVRMTLSPTRVWPNQKLRLGLKSLCWEMLSRDYTCHSVWLLLTAKMCCPFK